MSEDTLSKSRFIDGLRCSRCLYLKVYRPDLADPVTEEAQARFDVGNRVGALARKRYPEGVLVDDDHLHHKQAIEHTKALLADGASPIFEAAFAHDGVKVRADILSRNADGRFELLEVKSTGDYDEGKHLADVAVQRYVLEVAGIRLSDVGLMHLDKTYVYEGGDYDVDKLFAVTPLAEATSAVLPQIPGLVRSMQGILASDVVPQPLPDVDCKKPYPCPFSGYCHADDPEHPITELPASGRNTRLRKTLDARGLNDLAELPDDVVATLNRVQHLTWEATTKDCCIIEEGAAAALASLAFPIHFIDFETVNPGLPMFVGTHPFQTIPVQWSDHVLHEDGTLEHKEFLATKQDDPSREFAETLLDALGDVGSVVHYTPYEWTQMKSLAARFSDLSKRLLGVEPRLFDLANVVKDHCFDPRFHGRYSIKFALPVLAPELPLYKELAVHNGDMAMRVYAEMLDPDTPEERSTEIGRDLRVYCRQDTLGMVEIYRKLIR